MFDLVILSIVYKLNCTQPFVCLDTWRKDVKVVDIEDAINGAAPGKIRLVSVSQVSLMKIIFCSVTILMKQSNNMISRLYRLQNATITY